MPGPTGTSPYPQPGQIPKQTQINKDQPGLEKEMTPKPIYAELEGAGVTLETYKAAGKLEGKKAVITGGDSGIGRAAAVMFAKEGADVAIVYVAKEEEDAQETKAAIEKEGRKAVLIPTDISIEENCQKIIQKAVQEFGRIDVLVNNAAVQ
ncbi:hypothetical protein HK104_005414, partial [Borealophlyctis nickersoniae]